jgi:hypothetical protein
MRLACAALCVLTACAAPRASLPVFAPGPLTNLGGNEANMNASLHVLWGLAAGTVGYVIDGKKGLRWACGSWMAGSLVEETFFHAPPGPTPPGYPAEVRTDLLTRLAPCTAFILIEQFAPGPK